jgi:hypothetical protein
MKETIYIVWSRRNSHVILTIWRKACDLFRVPPVTRGGPMSISVVGEKADFSKDAEVFDGAVCDIGKLDHVVFSHQCTSTTLLGNVSLKSAGAPVILITSLLRVHEHQLF